MTVDSVATIEGALQKEQAPEPRRPLVAWDDLRHGRERIPSKALSSAAQLAREDLPLLIRTLSDRKRSSVATVILFLGDLWSDEFGAAWIASAPTRSMRACGMQAWIRRIADTSRAREEATTRLRLLNAALSSHAQAEVATLWWEAISIAGRYERRTQSEFLGALYEIAADVIADSGAIPDDDELASFARTNSGVAAVLPYAAYRAAEKGRSEFASLADDVFRREVRRLITTEGAHLSESMCGQILLESCSFAIMYSSDADWWVPIFNHALGTHLPWRSEASYEHTWKAAWLLGAAAMAADRLHRADGTVRADILQSIGAILDRHLAALFWGDTAGSREVWLYCAKLLGRALALDRSDGPRRIAALAEEVRTPEVMCEVLKGGGPVLDDAVLEKLVSLLRARIEFHRELRSDSPLEP